MERVYNDDCTSKSCEHKGTAHTHSDGDTAGSPITPWEDYHDTPESTLDAVDSGLKNRSPNHPVFGRNNADLTTGMQEAKIIPFKPRGK